MLRNRSEGWSIAKRSGHEFEDQFLVEVLDSKSEIWKALIEYLKQKNILGFPEKGNSKKGREHIAGIFGRMTTPKSDVEIILNTGAILNVSVKKPSTSGGQLHLSTLANFMAALDYYIKFRSANQRKMIEWFFSAFTGNIGAADIFAFAPKAKATGPIISKHNASAEIYQNRLYASTLQKYYPEEWKEVKIFFNDNMPELTKILFSLGYAKDKSAFADLLYYGNKYLFINIEDLCNASKNFSISPSSQGYYQGSTIIMPWGFLQVHRPGKNSGPYQLQFHHNSDQVSKILQK